MTMMLRVTGPTTTDIGYSTPRHARRTRTGSVELRSLLCTAEYMCSCTVRRSVAYTKVFANLNDERKWCDKAYNSRIRLSPIAQLLCCDYSSLSLSPESSSISGLPQPHSTVCPVLCSVPNAQFPLVPACASAALCQLCSCNSSPLLTTALLCWFAGGHSTSHRHRCLCIGSQHSGAETKSQASGEQQHLSSRQQFSVCAT